MRERLATLISGGGTTMREIIKACQSGEVPMDIACVISSDPSAGGIAKAKKLGIPEKDIIIVSPELFRGEDRKIDEYSFGMIILKELRSRGTTVVTQNGWMPHTPVQVIEEYKETIFNQHPGPVPEFGGKGMYGRRVHAARLLFVQRTERDYWTEAVVQRVDKKFDQGKVVASSAVLILPEDTVDDLQKRVLPVEHRVQIELLKDVARGNVNEQRSRKTLILPGEEKILLEAKRVGRLLYPKG